MMGPLAGFAGAGSAAGAGAGAGTAITGSAVATTATGAGAAGMAGAGSAATAAGAGAGAAGAAGGAGWMAQVGQGLAGAGIDKAKPFVDAAKARDFKTLGYETGKLGIESSKTPRQQQAMTLAAAGAPEAVDYGSPRQSSGASTGMAPMQFKPFAQHMQEAMTRYGF